MNGHVRLIDDDLRCRSEADARQAVEFIRKRGDALPTRMVVNALCASFPPGDADWYVEVSYFDESGWDESLAEELWFGLAPHLADDASLELEDDDGERRRIRWNAGVVHEEHVSTVLWTVSRVLTPPQKESTS